MFKKIYLKGNEYLIYIFPISIVFSNFLTNFIVYYLSFFGIYLIFKKKKIHLHNPIAYAFILFWIYISVRSLFSTDILFSLKSSLSLIRYILFFIAVNYIIKNNNSFIKIFTYVISIFISILFIDSFIQFFSGKNIFGYSEDINNFRISSFFSGRFVLGSYVSKIILLVILLLNFFYPIKKFKFSYLLILSISFLVILISGDRACLGLFTISILIIITLVDNEYINKKEKVFFILSIIFFLVSLLSISESFKSRFFYKTLSDIKSADKIYFFSKGHQSHWNTSYKMYLDNKFFGKGPNMFRKYCDSEKFYSGRKSCSTHPHNYYFQLIGETGIIGLAFLVYVYFLIIINLLRQFYNVYIKKKPYYEFHKLVLLALSFANFWPVITNGNLFGSFTSNMIILPICFYYAKPLVNQKNFINK